MRARLLTPRPVFSSFSSPPQSDNPSAERSGRAYILPRERILYYRADTLARAHTTAGARRVGTLRGRLAPGLPTKYIIRRRPRRRTRGARVCVSRGDADAAAAADDDE